MGNLLYVAHYPLPDITVYSVSMFTIWFGSAGNQSYTFNKKNSYNAFTSAFIISKRMFIYILFATVPFSQF